MAIGPWLDTCYITFFVFVFFATFKPLLSIPVRFVGGGWPSEHDPHRRGLLLRAPRSARVYGIVHQLLHGLLEVELKSEI